MSGPAPTRSPRRTGSASTRGRTSSRPSSGWRTSSSQPSPQAGSACASTARSGTFSPAWRTSSAGSSRTPRTRVSCARRTRAAQPGASCSETRWTSSGRRRWLPPRPAGPAFRNAPNTDFTPGGEPRAHANRPRGRGPGPRRPPPHRHRRQEDLRPRVSSPPRTRPRPAQVVGLWARATAADADAAVAAARAALPAWAARPAGERASVLDRAADLIEARRFALKALEVLEAAKPWVEADADVSEATDFCRFYASQMRRLGRPRRHPGACPASARPAVDGPRASGWPSRRGTSRSPSSAA